MAPATTSGSAATEAWTLLQRLMVGQKGRVHTIAAEFGLAPAQMLALQVLEPEHPCPMSALAQALRCDNSNVTGIVDRLEARGLVERRPGETDRRVKILAVTPAGEALRERLQERLREPPEALARLGEEDAQALRDILARALGDA
ncbi:MAG TPA: MarR family transcriptional regulator [Solirubrobacteraceae bacterium]|nr:MarR family transcriptional regulator [Solirubrobacteraceae bacterium]